jgi:predicted enzyme related to lactoylglutathione lyase
MKVDQLIVNVNSEQPEKLIAFYRDIVGLTPSLDFDEPGVFSIGTAMFIVEGHSEVQGRTKEPQRVLLNFVVDNVAAEQKRLEAGGIVFTRSAAKEPGIGVFATFLDPDGNSCQLVEFES